MATQLLKNPFVIIGNIPQEYFCDRREESARIVRTITNEGNLLLMSARRMGKSGLVRYCFELPEIKKSYYTFYIDILHTSSLREFVCTFGQQVFDNLRGTGDKALRGLIQTLKSLAGSFGYDPVTGSPTFQLEIGRISQPEYTLKEIFDWLESADRPCVVAFDEFQQIVNYPEKNVEALLRVYIQHLRNAHFIFAGSERHLLSEMFFDSARPFYNSTNQLVLLPIVPNEYLPFVCNCFKSYDKEIDLDSVRWAYDYLEGNTYCMQKLFHEAFINTAIGTVCSLELVQSTLNDILEEESAGFRKILSRVPERQKELLYAIVKEGHAQKVMSASFIRKHALASASSVQAALKKLLEEGLISVEDNVYYVPDIYFRLFIYKFL